MINLAKPRKVDESKNRLLKFKRDSKKIELKTEFPDILKHFESIIIGNNSRVADNQITSNAIRQLLSSLQSLLNRRESIQSKEPNEEDWVTLTNSMNNCLQELNILVSSESAFPETITLSALCIAFLFLSYFNHFRIRFSNQNVPLESLLILNSFKMYLNYLYNAKQLNLGNHFAEIFSNKTNEEEECLKLKSFINEIIIAKCDANYPLTFRDAAFLTGLFNCTLLVNFLMKPSLIESFLQLHSFILRLYDVLDNRQIILNNHFNKTTQDGQLVLIQFVEQTLEQIDHKWESPINGVGQSVKKSFHYLIELVHLSVNSLANAISEYYKSSIISFCNSSNQQSDNQLTELWTKHWLQPICSLFQTELSQSTVVQNVLLAHIFPFTLQNVPNSMSVLMNQFVGYSYGQISIVRIYLEKNSQSLIDRSQLPDCEWFKQMLTDSNDMTRAEALALLTDEKYIYRNRPEVCRLVLLFIKNNLNIDNPSFRQRIICKLEQFYSKVIISLVDRISNEKILDSDLDLVRFVKNSLDFFTLSLFPGSSFQRKYTSLNIVGALINIFDREDKEGKLLKIFDNEKGSPNNWRNNILFGLVDKDDKIRRMSTEIMIQFLKSQLSNEKISDELNLYQLAERFLQSPRHQESHIGGLLLKCLLRSNRLLPSINGYEMICELVRKSCNQFYSKQFRNNLLDSARNSPLHGNILALNHCLTFKSFQEIFSIINLETILFNSELRAEIFAPAIQLSLDCLEYFLKLLTPTNPSNNISEIIEDGDDDFSSPSFHEMCQSIEKIIQKNSNQNQDGDVFLSNDFQLILSMCWLNIKENCFLLTTLTNLYADLLNEIVDSDSLREKFMKLTNLNIIWVIEACGISLTKFIRTILRIQCYLQKAKHVDTKIGHSFRSQLELFISNCLSIIDLGDSTSTSITRRSAGLAFIIQAILVGEAEAIYLDGIKPIQNDRTLYDRMVKLLITTVRSKISESDNYQLVDLPQSNALHILQSIIGTSALSHLSTKTKKRVRETGDSTDSLDLGTEFGTTITFEEFAARYPSMLIVIDNHFDSCTDDRLHPELVPLLALLASFTPIGRNDQKIQDQTKDSKMIQHLTRFLFNKIWKIRMLSARALANLWSVSELESFIKQWCDLSDTKFTNNQLHGMMCCVDNLIELEPNMRKVENGNSFWETFKKRLDQNGCAILKDLWLTMFNKISDSINDEEVESKLEVMKIYENLNYESINVKLLNLKHKVNFKQPDDIRHQASIDMLQIIRSLQFPTTEIDISSFVKIILTVLEDEDRDVRMVGQRIVAQLEPNGHMMNQSESIEFFFQWLLSNKFGLNQQFTSQLLNRLIESSNLSTYIELFSNLNSKDTNQLVLFEREEKNVFAEPYLMSLRIGSFLQQSAIKLQDNKHWNTKQLEMNCKQIIEILKLENSIRIESLMLLSIWKLPDFMSRLMNLYIVLKFD
ncbi:hypothetical protein RDWZM_002038 [Blomia tropicalis]|uniref:Uncharacterized protein n=1 Tax=Blomia tropicalis TaxID=40697 RepID=A0A9Q0RPJ1_BLOTA|nr:hypothetical protein RDWZM_002038 [Blomia tropicalis]